MIRTWGFFTLGGFFTACYSNAVRRYPLMRKPQMHLICTGVACYLGYLAHRYEETSEERVQKLLEKHKRAPAEWAAMVKTEKGIGYSEEKFSTDNQ